MSDSSRVHEQMERLGNVVDEKGYFSDYQVSLGLQNAANRIARLEKVLSKTRSLICEGATEGFNPLEGDWADLLYANNGAIAEVLDK